MAICPPCPTMSLRRLGDEVEALLVHQARHDAEQRPVRVPQAQTGAHGFGVGPLAAQVVRIEVVRQVRIAARIPAFVDAVDDAGQFAPRGPPLHQAMQPAAGPRRGDLPRIARADRGHMVGIIAGRP